MPTDAEKGILSTDLNLWETRRDLLEDIWGNIWDLCRDGVAVQSNKVTQCEQFDIFNHHRYLLPHSIVPLTARLTLQRGLERPLLTICWQERERQRDRETGSDHESSIECDMTMFPFQPVTGPISADIVCLYQHEGAGAGWKLNYLQTVSSDWDFLCAGVLARHRHNAGQKIFWEDSSPSHRCADHPLPPRRTKLKKDRLGIFFQTEKCRTCDKIYVPIKACASQGQGVSRY